VRPAFRLSIALIGLALASWLGFVAWSLYSILPPGASDGARDSGARLPEQSRRGTSADLASRGFEAELQAANSPPPLPLNAGAGEPTSAIAGCGAPDDTSLQWNAEDLPPPEPVPATASAEELEERAMAGDVGAQFLIGLILQQELLGATAERYSVAPQRFEYMRNFLILATRNGSRSAAHLLADAYITTRRDVVEVAAWLHIAGKLRSYEQEGTLVLSDEQRAESLRVAAELATQHNLPVSRGDASAVSGGNAAGTAADDCNASGADGFLLAAAELDRYRADLERNSLSPAAVPKADLRRRFRDIRARLVTSLQLGDAGALPMLVTLHRTSAADEDAVAAAVWDRVGRELYGTSPDPASPNASAPDTLPALPPSAELPISAMRLADAEDQELADKVRRHGVRAGILADQYIMMFGLRAGGRRE
jgi:hypothetical protein